MERRYTEAAGKTKYESVPFDVCIDYVVHNIPDMLTREQNFDSTHQEGLRIFESHDSK